MDANDEARPWLLMKRGLYWRPNSQGYTRHKREAGRYTEQEALARCHDADGDPYLAVVRVRADEAPDEAPALNPDGSLECQRPPLAVILERLGKTQADLAALLGSRSRTSEYLNGRRNPTLAALRKIADAWSVPVDELLGDPPRQRLALDEAANLRLDQLDQALELAGLGGGHWIDLGGFRRFGSGHWYVKIDGVQYANPHASLSVAWAETLRIMKGAQARGILGPDGFRTDQGGLADEWDRGPNASSC